MKKIILIALFAIAASGCGGKKYTTCNPAFFTTSSTSVECNRVRFSAVNIPEDQQLFMGNTYVQVSEEASVGHGEHLNTLSTLLDCNNSLLLSQKLHSNYSAIFTQDSSPIDSLQEIHSLLISDPILQKSCSRVSGI